MLLIGETGVGKSTWINFFANYCKFGSLEEAEKEGEGFTIPCTFEITDPQTGGVTRISSEGSGTTELLHSVEVGDSVTQIPKEHVFRNEYYAITVIDTPGLMDTGDRDTSDHSKDKQNVSNILRLLSKYDEIHAICILLKAGENRISNAFKYTLTEILKRLDKGACNNVIFINTHAACTNFKPGKTQAILQRFLSENKLSIPLPPKRQIYCFENDTMNYLAQRRNKIEKAKDDEENARRNWDKSANSTVEMITCVSSLKPHSLAGLKAMYDAGQTTTVLSKIVVETLMCISKDTDDLEHKKKVAEKLKTEITKNPEDYARYDLKELLVIPERKVVHKALGHSNVGCEGPRCAKVVNGELLYPQVCCERCPSPWIYWCEKMKGLPWSASCSVCKCEKSKHEWTSTKTEIITVYKHDESVTKQIVDSNGALREINRAIAEYEDRVSKYKEETEKILRICAKLSTFTRKTAMMAHDDELSEILAKQIETYERALASSSTNCMYLKRFQHEYSQFLAAEKETNNDYDVHELIQQLFTLPMKGDDLRAAVEEEERAEKMVVDNSSKTNTFINRLFSKLTA